MELFSPTRWRLVSAQFTNKFRYYPSPSLLFWHFINTPAYHWTDTSLHLPLAADLPGYIYPFKIRRWQKELYGQCKSRVRAMYQGCPILIVTVAQSSLALSWIQSNLFSLLNLHQIEPFLWWGNSILQLKTSKGTA